MNKNLKNKLLKIAKQRQTKTDPSHDFGHVLRVVNLAEQIGKKEKADMDIVIASAIFHDIIVYRKDSPQSKNETDQSAKFAANVLKRFKTFPKNKISKVQTAIRHCSFSKGIKADFLESQILQDADRLEATGAISIMRTFSSCGHMNRSFYNPKSPFFKKGEMNFPSGIGLFYRRLLVVEKSMNIKFAKKIARRRTQFLKKFLAEFKLELKESKII